MRNLKLTAALVMCAIGLAFAAPSHAQTLSQQELDLRCAAFGFAVASLPNAPPEQQSGAAMLAIYYVGRAEGRDPNLNLEDALFELSQSLPLAELQSEGQRCGPEFQAIGQGLISMGANLQRRAAAAGN